MNQLFTNIIQEFKETYRFRYVVYSFVETNLKMRYRRSILGFLWTVVAPLTQYLILGIVFSQIVRVSIKDYVVFYITGAVFFNLISGLLSKAPTIILGSESFIKKIYLPKLVYIVEHVFLDVVNFLLTLVALIIIGIVFSKIHLSYSLVYVPFAFLCLLLFLIGASIIISIMSVYFRDLNYIMPIGMQALFFLTPIIYNVDMLSPRLRAIIAFNPLCYFLDFFRTPILYQKAPELMSMWVSFAIGMIVFLFGLFILKKFDNKIVFKL